MAGLWSDHFPTAVKTPETFSPCKTKGTWSQLFSSAEKPPSPTPPPPLGRYQRCLLCRTCNASCRLFTSNTPQNPNRQFYKCAAVDHKFFKWADEAKPDEFIDVPYCGGCSAGVCRVRKEKSGPNAGRVLFMCRVKEGEGSCGYRAWQDELAKSADERMTSSESPTSNGDSRRPSNNDLVKENRQSNDRAHNESPVTDPLFRKSEHLKYQENNHYESWMRAQKIPYERVTSLRSPSHAVSTAHTKRANIVFVEESSQSNGAVDNESPESTRRARRLSDVRITLFQSPTVDGNHTMPANSDLVEENSQSNEGADSGSPVIDTLENHGLGVTSRNTAQSKCLENQNNESSPRRPHKRSRQGDLKAPSTLVSSQSLTLGPTMDSVLAKHCWMVAAIRQNLSSQLQGWWGRLAFHPRPCLMTRASKSLDCYVSSPQDSTFTVQDEILVKSRGLTTLTRILLGVESYDKPLLNRGQDTRLSGTKKPSRVALDASLPGQPSTGTNVPNVMSESISKAFGQAADHLRSDFLSLLNKMDVGDYEAMSREAEATFAALDRLLFNYRDFEGRTKEYIQCAASLAEIERSMPGDESYQKLIEHCSSERMRLDEINSVHAEAVDSVNRSKKRLRSLQDEVSSTMDWLFQIEAELSCREVEMGNMERELEKICRNKEVLEEKYMIAAEELERSKMVFERKEAERDAAKAAFGRAREMLRGIE